MAVSCAVKVILSSVSVEVEGGKPPFSVELAGARKSKSSRCFAFMDVPGGPHVLVVRDADGNATSQEVVIP